MNIVSEILNFLKDGSLSFGKKSLVIIFLLLSVVIINYMFSFSFNYSVNQELNQIEKIAKIRKEYALNDSLNKELGLIEKSIIHKNNIFRRTNQYISINKNDSSSKTSLSKDSIAIIKPTETHHPIQNHKIIKERNWIKYLLTSSYGFLIILILLPLVPFFNIKDFWQTFLGVIIFIILDLCLLWLNYMLYSLIPDFNELWINYILNLILHTIFIAIIIRISIKTSKTKKQ